MTRYLLIGSAVLSLVTSQASYSQDAPDQASKAKREVIASITKMTEAFERGDVPAVLASYESKALVAFDPGKPTTDAAALQKQFDGASHMKPQFEYGEHDVYIVGDIALHIAPWEMKGKTPDGKQVEQRGLSVTVLRRQPDGRWLMVIDNPHGQRLLDKPTSATATLQR